MSPVPLATGFDRALQLQVVDPVLAMPAPLQNFEGINNIAGVAPPDTCGDVGPNHYVQAVNLHFQVFDKSGSNLLGPLPLNSIWSGFGGVCETLNDGDPIVLYDQWADRWFISQFALDYGDQGFHQCIAVSTSGDPTGTWHRYDYFMSDTIMNDYPKFGIWPDGYYMAINQFDASRGNAFAGQGVAVFDRSNMLSGNAAAMQYFDLFSVSADLFGMLPADADGLIPPDAGEPNHFVMIYDDSWGASQDQLQMYDFHVDWAIPANTTFAPASASPLNTDSFSWFSGDVPQPDTTQQLDAIGDRLMYRLQFRNLGTHKSMVVNHTVDSGSSVAAIRWYELRNSGSGWSIHQQGTYAGDSGPDGNHRWMGSVALDIQGNMALGYSITNGTDLYPSIRYTGRLAADPSGVLGQGEMELQSGSGSQTGINRWGDYSMMSVDPIDECTFWYTQEYYPVTDGWNWHTRVGSFVFPGCVIGPSGTLEGVVRDMVSDPVDTATVTADNGAGVVLSTVSTVDGTYRFAFLPPGTYTVSVSRFGYLDETVSGIVVIADTVTVQDFNLTSAELFSLSGQVSDAVTGWPLYAQINYGQGTVWTDPATGLYSVALPQGDYVVDVTSFAAGYDPTVRNITLLSDQTEDFSLIADGSCQAPGYSILTALSEQFAGCALPDGWAVVNNGGDCEWTFDDPGRQGNLTGGDGCFADADSDACGAGTSMDTELISPSFDCSAMTSVTLEFKFDVRAYISDTFDVDVSIDGGNTWTNIQRWTSSRRGPQTAQFDIGSLAAGEADVRVRFHYTAGWDWWWQVDDVSVYQPICLEPITGGMLYGNVADANTGIGLNGGLVSDQSGNSTITEATPTDSSIGDGFYMLYIPGSSPVNISASVKSPRGYDSESQVVSVPVLGSVKQDYFLAAGKLTQYPPSYDVAVVPDTSKSLDLLLANSGGKSAAYKFFEVDGPVPDVPNGPFADAIRHVSPKHLFDRDASLARFDYPALTAMAVLASAGDVIQTWPTGLAFPWGTGFDKQNNTVWLGNLAAAGGDDIDYEFDQDGTSTGRYIDTSVISQVFMADFAYDLRFNTLWQMNVGGGDCIHEMDPTTLVVTGNVICPAFGISQRGLAYNVKTDTFYAGSWNDSTIYEFDRAGSILRSVNVGLPISGLAFNPLTDHLFVMNSTDYLFPVAVLDVLDNFKPLFAFAVPGFSPDGGAGLAMDSEGYLWAVDQVTGTVFQFASGEPGGSLDIEWLSKDSSQGMVSSGGNATVRLDFNASGYAAGEIHQGYLIMHSDTPYSVGTIPLTMTVMDLPTIISSSYYDVTKVGAQVSAVVDPKCVSTEYYFEYGTVPGVYDSKTASEFSASCTSISIDMVLEGMEPGTTYYVRLVAVNAAGVTYGTVMTFTTYSFPWILFMPAIHAQSSYFRGVF